MPRVSITQEMVDDAIKVLLARGIAPTYVKVRDVTKTGSYLRIQKLMESSTIVIPDESKLADIPRSETVSLEMEAKEQDLLSQISKLLKEQISEAEQRGYAYATTEAKALREQIDVLEADIEKKDQALEDADQKINQMQREFGSLETRLADLTQINAKHDEEVSQYKKEIEAIKKEAAEERKHMYELLVGKIQNGLELTESSAKK